MSVLDTCVGASFAHRLGGPAIGEREMKSREKWEVKYVGSREVFSACLLALVTLVAMDVVLTLTGTL
jgi:hypothetical protein